MILQRRRIPRKVLQPPGQIVQMVRGELRAPVRVVEEHPREEHPAGENPVKAMPVPVQDCSFPRELSVMTERL